MNQTTFLVALLAGNFENIGKVLESFLSQWWGPLIGIVSAAAAILGITAGVKYILASQSGDEQKIKQAKNFIIGIIIGIAVMFLLTGVIPVLVAAFGDWYDNDAQDYISSVITKII